MSYYLNLKQGLGQKIQNLTNPNSYLTNKNNLTNKNKMGFGTKLLIAGVALGGASYLLGRKIWNYFYPPSLKRYVAVSCMVLAFWGLRNWGVVSRELGNMYYGAKQAIEQRIDRTVQVKKLETRIRELTTINTYFKESNTRKALVLTNAKEYINNLELKYFNTKYKKRKGPFGIFKDKPPGEAFQEYLIHNKEYNSIMYEIDKELKHD